MPSCRIVKFSAFTAAQSSGSIAAPADSRIHLCPRNERCQRRRTPRCTREALTLQRFLSRHSHALLLSIFWCLRVLPVGAVDSVVVGTVTTLAGGGPANYADGTSTNAQFNQPYGVMLDRYGTFALIPDSFNHVVRYLDVSMGSVTTVAGNSGVTGSSDGIGTAVTFYLPSSCAMSRAGSFAFIVRDACQLCWKYTQNVDHARPPPH